MFPNKGYQTGMKPGGMMKGSSGQQGITNKLKQLGGGQSGGMGQSQQMGMQRPPRYRTGMAPGTESFQGQLPGAQPQQGAGPGWGGMQQMGSAPDLGYMPNRPSAAGFNGVPGGMPPMQPKPPASMDMGLQTGAANVAPPASQLAAPPPPPPPAQPQYQPMSPGNGMPGSNAAQGYLGGFVNPAMSSPDQFSRDAAQRKLQDQGQTMQMGGFGPASMGFQGY